MPKLFHVVIVVYGMLVLCAQVRAEIIEKANPLAGHIVQFNGTVLMRANQSSSVLKITEPGSPLFVDNLLRTQQGSSSFIEWIDGSKVVIKEFSQLRIKAIDYLVVENGVVVFDITKKTRSRPVRIGVKLAILGIRGTQFLVDSREKDTYQIYLKQGQITITSVAEDFRIYQQQIETEMRQFRQQLAREFNQFKQQSENGQAEFVKEFTMIESMGVSIKGDTISLIPMAQDIEAQFKLLERF